nr:hypothetical protein [Anatilimnocola floriformis]
MVSGFQAAADSHEPNDLAVAITGRHLGGAEPTQRAGGSDVQLALFQNRVAMLNHALIILRKGICKRVREEIVVRLSVEIIGVSIAKDPATVNFVAMDQTSGFVLDEKTDVGKQFKELARRRIQANLI